MTPKPELELELERDDDERFDSLEPREQFRELIRDCDDLIKTLGEMERLKK